MYTENDSLSCTEVKTSRRSSFSLPLKKDLQTLSRPPSVRRSANPRLETPIPRPPPIVTEGAKDRPPGTTVRCQGHGQPGEGMCEPGTEAQHPWGFDSAATQG
ncbi:hypothetical protein GOBAR_DD04343 [Gossypium barbadense]|nr:hypothetical protein GOBAR_DD04343 [Gossypium barbadense]